MQRSLPGDGGRSQPMAFPDERGNSIFAPPDPALQSSFQPPYDLDFLRFYDCVQDSYSDYSPHRYSYADATPIHPQLVDPLSFHLERLDLNGDSVFSHNNAGNLRFVDHGLLSDDPRRQTAQVRQQSFCPPLKHLHGKILMLATDRNCSRLLQKKIKEGIDKEEIEVLFSELIEYVGLLMVDKTANFVLQSLLDVLDEQQVTQIIKKITTTEHHFIVLCLNSYGTRVLQKLLRQITTTEQKLMMASAIVSDVVSLMNDSTAHRIIEICLETFSHDEIAVIYHEIIPNCYEIATNKYGCRIIQRLIDAADGIYGDVMVNVLVVRSLGLATDCYGNYVVQFLLGMGIPQVTANLILQLRGNFCILSCDKYGSNVVETCLRESSDEEFEDIVMELLQSCFCLVLLDPFGNYVIQSAVKWSKERRLWLVSDQLKDYISRYRQQMNCHFYGKKALTRLERRKTPQLGFFK